MAVNLTHLNHNIVEEDDFMNYGEYKAGVLIWKIIPPILILLGTVGNTLSIIVLTRRSIRVSTTALYLTVLAFSDLVVLYSGLLRQWLLYVFETDVRHVSDAGCKINLWLVYSSLDFSAWILIAVTLERVVSAWFPHHAKTTCTKNAAMAFMVSIGIFILCLNSHLMYGMAFNEEYDAFGNVVNIKKCTEVNDEYSNFFNRVWPWIDLCAFCAIPFSVIVIGNGLILYKVLQSQKKAKSRIVPTVHTGNGHRQHTTTHHHGKHSSMTTTLFTLNIVFLVSTSPVSIYNIGYSRWVASADAKTIARLDLWWAIVNMLMYTNNSLNFLLYCLSGTKFRQEVVRIFCLTRNQRNNSVRHTPSNYTRTHFDHSTNTPAIGSHISKTPNCQNGPHNLLTPCNSPSSNTLFPPISTVSTISQNDVSNSHSGCSTTNLLPIAAMSKLSLESNEPPENQPTTLSSSV